MSFPEAPPSARAVIVGAGIVGNSLAYHLTKLGWRDLVLLDKGPMPNPGGSTGHASNFIFPIDYSRMMTELTADSTTQYKELGVHIESGGIEVARTADREEEFRRRASVAKAWGIPVEIISPAAVADLVPYLAPAAIRSGLYFPTCGVVDSLRAGTMLREAAQEAGALKVLANTEVLGIETGPERASAGMSRPCVRRLLTSRGVIETEIVVVCCGVWSPRVAAMAGARIPLTPIVHQMISVGPIPLFAGTQGEIGYPIVRDVDTGMYERQHGGDIEVGSYAHRPIVVDPGDIPSSEEASLSPTELPFTQDDFDPQLADALELMPQLLGDEKVGIRYAINGLISITPDGHPVLGESPDVGGLWSAAASWIKEGPGIGRAVAQLMVAGESEVDVQEADAARFYPFQCTRRHVVARASESFNKMYGIVHPGEQWATGRDVRLAPMNSAERDLGAVFFETAGWERPFWYESNASLLERYGDSVMPRTAEWESRWWSPIVNAEHLAMREGAGLVDLSAFAIFDVAGPGALDSLQRIAVAQLDVPPGRVVYTPFLDTKGGFRADLTIMRLGEERFRVVTGGLHGMADRAWIERHLRDDGSAQVSDLTSSFTTIGLWGPNARQILERATGDDVSAAGFGFGSCRTIELGAAAVLASRISYVGELGWEIYVPMEQGAYVWSRLEEAGGGQDLVPVGIGVYGTTGRIEKGYRAFGSELTPEYNPVEAGMARPKVKAEDFVGKEAHLRHREEEPAALLCTLRVEDHTATDGRRRYMIGGEPIVTPGGERISDRKGRPSYATTAGSAPSLGCHLLLAYLPPEHAVAGNELAVEYMSERYPVSVAVVGSAPLFDPEARRARA